MQIISEGILLKSIFYLPLIIMILYEFINREVRKLT